MIIKLLIFFTILILITLLIIFLAVIFVPALKKQTNIEETMILAKNEHEFEKLKNKADVTEINQKAVILCNCNKIFNKKSEIISRKGQSCAVINNTFGSLNDCKFSCIGLGDCVRSCPQEAISVVNGTAVINILCNGCGECLSICPKKLIKLVPAATTEIVLCNNSEQKLTSCDSLGKIESLSYLEKKGFKIWESCYKILKNSL